MVNMPLPKILCLYQCILLFMENIMKGLSKFQFFPCLLKEQVCKGVLYTMSNTMMGMKTDKSKLQSQPYDNVCPRC